jgi:hypothetical protein
VRLYLSVIGMLPSLGITNSTAAPAALSTSGGHKTADSSDQQWLICCAPTTLMSPHKPTGPVPDNSIRAWLHSCMHALPARCTRRPVSVPACVPARPFCSDALAGLVTTSLRGLPAGRPCSASSSTALRVGNRLGPKCVTMMWLSSLRGTSARSAGTGSQAGNTQHKHSNGNQARKTTAGYSCRCSAGKAHGCQAATPLHEFLDIVVQGSRHYHLHCSASLCWL